MKIQYQVTHTDPVLSFAGEELCRYLGRMLDDEPGIFSVALEVCPGAEDLDGFTVDFDGTGGTITGRNPRSVLLGVYDYLHHLGCRFLTAIKETEVVPPVSRQDLTARYTKQASFRHRGVCIEGANSLENVLDFVDWLPKLGYNSFFLQFRVPYTFFARWYTRENNPYATGVEFTMEDAKGCMHRVEQEMKKRGLLLHKVGHGWTGLVLGDDDSASWNAVDWEIAPEKKPLAALVGGKRKLWGGVPLNTNLCFSNPKAVDAFADQVVSYARQNPEVDCLHVWLSDASNNVCECAECSKTTLSDQYVEVLNEIDRRLSAEGLPTRIVFLLYQELLWPPVARRLHNPDRFMLMFAPITRTFEHSYDLSDRRDTIPDYVANHITLPTSLGENLAFLHGWQQGFQGEGFVYDYPLGRAHYGDFGYLHIARIISQDIKKLRELKLDGYISCQELRAGMPNMLPNYVMGRTLFDESADVESLTAEYFEAAYPGAPQVARDYLQRLSELSSCDYLNGKGSRVDPVMAERMKQIVAWCYQQEEVLSGCPQGLHWNTLRYHNGYILRLAGAMGALASGDETESHRLYTEFRDYICQGEGQFQPWLDVYRVLEVTRNYTGLRLA